MIIKKLFLVIILFFVSTSSYSASMNMIGEKGDPSKIDRTIEIEMYDNYYYPTQIEVKKVKQLNL